MNFLHFPELDARGLAHAFTMRTDPAPSRQDLPKLLQTSGLPKNYVMGEQVHGTGVGVVGKMDGGEVVSGVDALISREKGLSLVIRVADCGPVWIHCAKTGAIGLVHSGRKGTEAGVVTATIRRMKEEFGSNPQEMLAFLGPCIRPPYYDVDFASEIICQLRGEKVGKVVDSGLCTAADLKRFYSYRAEKGQTGRHFGIAAL